MNKISDPNEVREQDFWKKAWQRAREASFNQRRKIRGEEENALTPRSSVLDVGCGNGTYAIPFAERVNNVTGIDNARQMCNTLEENAKRQNLENIQTIWKDWKELDLKQAGMENKFDI